MTVASLVLSDLTTLRQCLALPSSAHQWLREQIARIERFVEERCR